MTDGYAETIIRKIDELKPHIGDLRGRSGPFIQDQIKRIEQYGARTRWSAVQIKWINDLHDEFVGTDDPSERPDDDDDKGPGEPPPYEFAPR